MKYRESLAKRKNYFDMMLSLLGLSRGMLSLQGFGRG